MSVGARMVLGSIFFIGLQSNPCVCIHIFQIIIFVALVPLLLFAFDGVFLCKWKAKSNYYVWWVLICASDWECLCAMFGFLIGSIHISMDTTCDDKNIITNGICQLTLFGSHGLYWLVSISRYRTIGDQLLKGWKHDKVV